MGTRFSSLHHFAPSRPDAPLPDISAWGREISPGAGEVSRKAHWNKLPLVRALVDPPRPRWPVSV